MGDMGFFHNIQKDVRSGIPGNKGSVEKLEMSPLRQTTGATLIWFNSNKRRHLCHFCKNPVQFRWRDRTKDVNVNGQTADHRGMQQKACAPLEDELQVAFRQMSKESERMESPFKQSGIDTF